MILVKKSNLPVGSKQYMVGKYLVSCALVSLSLGLLSVTKQAHSPNQNAAQPFFESELIFPLEHWHNHASSIVECPNGDLLVCWFHGSGERQADDVKVEGARKKRGARQWSPRFTMADTRVHTDTNCTMFIDPQRRLCLL